MNKRKIFILEDDADYASLMADSLNRDREYEYEIIFARNLDEADKLIENNGVDLCFVDLCLDGEDAQNKDGIDFIKKSIENGLQVPVVVLSQYDLDDLPETIIELFRLGIADFYRKGHLRLSHLPTIVQKSLEKYTLGMENRTLRRRLELYEPNEIIGNSRSIQKIRQQVVEYGRIFDDKSSVTVLVVGETGTGKELVARALHSSGDRREHPLVAVNISALPAELVEAELFGYEKGAFTGALSRKIGYFESADRGTLFLDEIGDLSPHLQIKLLRVLQERKFSRLGSPRAHDLDIQLICATNRSLEELIAEDAFRRDLYYRINVARIDLPPLRERREDISLLTDAILKRLQNSGRCGDLSIPQKVTDILHDYSWPGNVRELQNLLERMVLQANSGKNSKLTMSCLPGELLRDTGAAIIIDENFDLSTHLAAEELKYIDVAIAQARNQGEAAKLLGTGYRDRFALARRRKLAFGKLSR